MDKRHNNSELITLLDCGLKYWKATTRVEGGVRDLSKTILIV